jgi:hypothetical protein
MKQFPTKLTPNNKHIFPQINFNLLLEKWREKTCNYILSNDKSGLELCDENKNIIDKRIIECLRYELKHLGWNTSLAFNGTVLFIYNDDDKSEIDKYKLFLSEDIFE